MVCQNDSASDKIKKIINKMSEDDPDKQIWSGISETVLYDVIDNTITDSDEIKYPMKNNTKEYIEKP